MLTRWDDAASYQAWLESNAFKRGHGQDPGSGERARPVGVASEIWNYQVAVSS